MQDGETETSVMIQITSSASVSERERERERERETELLRSTDSEVVRGMNYEYGVGDVMLTAQNLRFQYKI
jgi:epoxyqueuosine reductase QueG